MPRTREFEPRDVLGKAMHLFWQHGYTDTSMDDLVVHTGVSRYGLYGTFGDKHDLFVAALDQYRDTIPTALLGPLERPDASLAAITRYFETFAALAAQPEARMGCLMANTAVELAPFEGAIAQRVEAHFARMRSAFHGALVNAQQQGELPAETQTEQLADYLLGVAQGLTVCLRAALLTSTIQNYVAVALKQLR